MESGGEYEKIIAACLSQLLIELTFISSLNVRIG